MWPNDVFDTLDVRGGHAKCPAHEDNVESLSVTLGDNGIIIHCHAGCGPHDIIKAAGLEWSDLFPEGMVKKDKSPLELIATYDYGDYQVLRYHPKTFRQRRKVGDDYVWNLEGVKRVPYHLDALKAAGSRWVFFVEGEKDVETLESHGFIATTTAGGSGSWREDMGPFFRGLRVCVVPDNDDPGRAYAQRVASALSGTASEVRILQLPGVPKKGDVTDYFNAGGTADELKSLVSAVSTTSRVPSPTSPGSNVAPKSLLVLDPLTVTRASDVEPEKVEWLWPGWVAYGKLSIIEGDPGLGKSTLTISMASRASRHGMNVILLSAEDGLSDTIVPRLRAHRADLDRVVALEAVQGPPERPWSLPEDVSLLRDLIVAEGAKLVVIDPLMAFLSGNHSSNSDQDVRRALHPLADLADQTGAAIVLVRHLRKGRDGPAINQGGGSVGIGGAARSVLLVASDPHNPDTRVLASTKSNLGPKPPSQSFRQDDVPEHGCAKITWLGASPHTAETLLSHVSEEDVEDVGNAGEYLQMLLNRTPMPVADVLKLMRAQGISDKTTARARRMLGIRVTTGHDGVFWGLPDGR